MMIGEQLSIKYRRRIKWLNRAQVVLSTIALISITYWGCWITITLSSIRDIVEQTRTGVLMLMIDDGKEKAGGALHGSDKLQD